MNPCGGCSTCSCGCCQGVEALTPLAVYNRPGLPAIRYGAGGYVEFFETMKARLSTLAVPTGDGAGDLARPLVALRTREPADPSIALLDAWATVADILSFYQERIANEGYLETATERLSVLQLARLVGYRLRPGVAASVHLAFTLETTPPGQVPVGPRPPESYHTEIPIGTRAQSVPAPGETMQSFETAERFVARSEWNALRPRLGRPQVLSADDAESVSNVYLKGTATNLKKGDALLLVVGRDQADRVLRFVAAVELQQDDDRTKVTLFSRDRPRLLQAAVEATVAQARASAPAGARSRRALAVLDDLATNVSGALSPDEIEQHIEAAATALEPIHADAQARGFTRVAPWTARVIAQLRTPAVEPTAAIANGRKAVTLTDLLPSLVRVPLPPPRAVVDPRRVFSYGADTPARALSLFRPALADLLYSVWNRLPSSQPETLQVFALRVVSSPFGYNAAKQVTYDDAHQVNPQSDWEEWAPANETTTILSLESAHDDIRSSGYAVLVGPGQSASAHTPALGARLETVIGTRTYVVEGADTISRTDYGISAKTTRLYLNEPWWKGASEESIATLRRTLVYAGSEQLETADEPIEDDVAGQEIELGDLYEGLEAGRPVIVEGERTLDGVGGTGKRVAELAILAGVQQGVAKLDPGDARSADRPGERVHTTLQFTAPLTFTYSRPTVGVYANVIRATHGESRAELLGSGDGSKVLQSFALRQPPLTYTSAPTASGVDSTLEVRVDDLLWHESDSFLALGPADRGYVTRTGDDGKTTVVFGDGRRGRRLPTGVNNVAALYRSGIGKPGNVRATAITLLAAKPLGVKDVVNPLPASGGADAESRDQARRNVPVAVSALDRLVSVQDYEDFARMFGGIGKASASRFPLGTRAVVHVTVAAVDDAPLATDSDLYRNLLLALQRFGDPLQAVQLAVRELVIATVNARIRIDPDYLWADVEAATRALLQDRFGFENRDLAQSLATSEVLAAIQSVAGVVYAELELTGLTEDGAVSLLTPRPSRERFFDLPVFHRMQSRGIRVFPARPGDDGILPAQIAYVTPDLRDAVVLTEITS